LTFLLEFFHANLLWFLFLIFPADISFAYPLLSFLSDICIWHSFITFLLARSFLQYFLTPIIVLYFWHRPFWRSFNEFFYTWRWYMYIDNILYLRLYGQNVNGT
jgi:hypothetical protein